MTTFRRVAFCCCVALVIVFVSWLICSGDTIFALGARDFELTFVISDAETAAPIQGANLVVRIDDTRHDEHRILELTTDVEGKAILFRKDEWIEEIIRPCQKTKLLFFLSWGVLDVAAEGYHPIEKVWFPELEPKDSGYDADRRVHRLEFAFQLHKAVK